MKILRAFAGIVVGYLIYAISSMLMVGVVMGRSGAIVIILGLVGLAVIGLVAGCATAKISGDTRRLTGLILAGLVVVATLANLLLQLGAEPTWYKVGTLLLTAPAILVACVRSARGEGQA